MSEGELEALKRRLKLELDTAELRRAFLHSSYVNEQPPELKLESNERLEFLGDAVIELAISEYLFKRFPSYTEGELTKIKSVVVSGPVLAEKARELELGRCLFLGVGEEESGGRERSSILADALEALVGLLFLKWGYRRAARFALRILKDEVEKVARHQQTMDYKSLLQEEAQRRGTRPVYSLIKEEGADHQKVFTVKVEVAGLEGIGRGRRVKEAEQAAAKQVYFKLAAKSEDKGEAEAAEATGSQGDRGQRRQPKAETKAS